MKALVYGKSMVADRISPLVREADVEILTISGEIIWAKRNCLLRNLPDLGLAILDTNEKSVTSLCPFLSRLKYIPIILLVNNDAADWAWLGDCEASAYVSLETGKEEFVSRLKVAIKNYLPKPLLVKV
jgi:AmiR/NasT family two-component response regulator